LPLEAIEAQIGPVRLIEAMSAANEPQPSPGRLLRHYATRTALVIADAEESPPSIARVGLLTLAAKSDDEHYAAIETLSPAGDLAEAAANLFAAMRRLDARGLDLIVVRFVPEVGLGRAINDRLRRAAHRTTAFPPSPRAPGEDRG
jgi:L-threonylcarbamoyladenylate synthase